MSRSNRTIGLIIGAAFLVLSPLVIPGESEAASRCATSAPAGGAYTVTLCITAPGDGAVLTGTVPVTASVTTTGSSPGVGRMHFSLNGIYALTDREAPYGFYLPTARRIDGDYYLEAVVVMNDSFVAAPASADVTLSNGVTSPPTNTARFVPRTGTKPAPGRPFVVAAVGDGASGRKRSTEVADAIASMSPNLVLYSGDVYDRGSDDEFFNWYAPATELGRFKDITNPSPGNHEYETPGAAGYFNYWDNVPHYYSYNTQGWHLINLDSTGNFGQRGSSSPQYEWLQNDLTTDTARCAIATYHHPRFSRNGEEAEMQDIWSLLARYGVDIVINGHNHNYQRFQPLDDLGNPSPSGTTQFTVGTGGVGPHGFTTPDPRFVAGADSSPNAYGALRMELRAGAADFRYQTVAGTTIDSGTVTCNDVRPPAGPSPTPSATPSVTPTPTASPGSLTFEPIRDATVKRRTPRQNFGPFSTLTAGRDPMRRFYLTFDLTGIEGQVKNAVLRLRNLEPSKNGGRVHKAIDSSWQEDRITWLNAPAFGPSVTAIGRVDAGTTYEVDVTSLVTGDGTLSLVITSKALDAVGYSSREGRRPPQLVVTTG